MTREELNAAAHERQVALARAAVDLVSDDLRATTDLPAPSFDYRVEPGSGVRVSYFGQYSPSTIMGLSAAAVAAEVAGFMQDEIVEDMQTGWPMCREHGVGAYAQVTEGQAVWFCRTHQHVVAPIGRLAR